jgi:hypothetical protein
VPNLKITCQPSLRSDAVIRRCPERPYGAAKLTISALRACLSSLTLGETFTERLWVELAARRHVGMIRIFDAVRQEVTLENIAPG